MQGVKAALRAIHPELRTGKARTPAPASRSGSAGLDSEGEAVAEAEQRVVGVERHVGA